MLFDPDELEYIGIVQRSFTQWFNNPPADFSAFIVFHASRAERRLRKMIGDDVYDAIEAGTETDADFANDMERAEMILTAIEMLKSDKVFNDNEIMAAAVQNRISTARVTKPSISNLTAQAFEILLEWGYGFLRDNLIDGENPV